jgi:octaprenyl-diphosphate synthase
VSEALQNYGRSLGIAFQIADDLLDVLGNEAETGKSLGTDFEKQKLTLPLIHLLAQATPTDAARIRHLLTHPDERSRQELQGFLGRSDSIAYARARGNEFAAAARGNLSCLPDSPARHLLEELTEFVTQRSN